MAFDIQCVLMRGGTSKAVFLKEEVLPVDEESRRRLILRIFGSPDPRQIDGLGGADPLTSKLAIIGPAREAGTDLTYSFGQVEINEPAIDWLSLCGNITSAVGVFAIEEGYVAAREPVTTVAVFNTNLKRRLLVDVPVRAGRVVEAGDFAIPGVPGCGARIDVDFAHTAGAATGALLPTGNPVDEIHVPGSGLVAMSLVDIGNAHVFVRAHDIGMRGTETATEIDGNPDLLKRLELIRGAGAVRMGLASTAEAARHETPARPIIGVIGVPADYQDDLSGRTIRADEVDVVSRLQFMQRTHKTYAGTSTACTGVAARLSGTVVHELSRKHDDRTLRIGHPAGVIVTDAIVNAVDTGFEVGKATLGRTARRIMEGMVFVPDERAEIADSSLFSAKL